MRNLLEIIDVISNHQQTNEMSTFRDLQLTEEIERQE